MTAIPLRRLRFTPMRDLVRGRLTGRLDWRGRIAASGLPEPARAHVARVVARTRLWRSERAEVADELIAHFADAIAAGTPVDEAIRDFGDARSAARLIRRATIRKRPLAWHAFRIARVAFVILIAVYAVLLARFLLGRPTPRIDYAARLNADALARPADDHAYPLYRAAAIALDRSLPRGTDEDNVYLLDAKPGDARWDELRAWLTAQRPAVDQLREAARRPTLGLLLGPDGSRVDAEMARQFPREGWLAPDEPKPPRSNAVLLGDQEPYFTNIVGQIVNVLDADGRVACAEGDAARAAADVEALLGLARQSRGQALHNTYTYFYAVGGAARMMRDAPPPDDATLIRLAHALGAARSAADLIDFTFDRAEFADLLQKAYTDDGRGDGRLTVDGARFIRDRFGGATTSLEEFAIRSAVVYGLPSLAIGGSRREAAEAFDTLMNWQERLLALPRRDADWAAVDAWLNEQTASGLPARPLAVVAYSRSSEPGHRSAETSLGLRDGVLCAIALELHRRRHGDYPATLDALAPQLLPAVPIDRITGGPVRYRVVDGRPVIYSVGVDLDDDGGRAPTDLETGEPEPTIAAQWPTDTTRRPKIDGDWILYDGRRR